MPSWGSLDLTFMRSQVEGAGQGQRRSTDLGRVLVSAPPICRLPCCGLGRGGCTGGSRRGVGAGRAREARHRLRHLYCEHAASP
eukprot:scaffold1447_cov115-Isochrysis_galbana.AAC.4